MPLAKFLGFPTGSSVSLAASQGTETDAITVAPWNVARTTENLSLAVTRHRAEFRRAPEAVWFEAMPTGFKDLTQNVTVPDISVAADWENGTGTYSGLTEAASPETDRPVTIKIASVQAGAAPSGLLWHSGGASVGLAAAFDGDGNLVVGAGDATATETGMNAVFLTVSHLWFINRNVDIWIALRPEDARMRVYVVDNATQVLLSAPVVDVTGTLGMPGSGLGPIPGIFANGEEGGYYNIDDLTTLGTSASSANGTSVGDIVRFISDKSGNNRPMTWPVNIVNAPELGVDGDGRHFIKQGVTDAGIFHDDAGVSIIGAEGMTTSVFVSCHDNWPESRCWTIGRRSGRKSFMEFDGLQPRTTITVDSAQYSDLSGEPAVAIGQKFSFTGIVTDGSVQTWQDGASDGPTAFASGAYEITSGGWGVDLKEDFRFYSGVIVDRALTTQERIELEAYLANPGSFTAPLWSDAGGVGVGEANGTVRAGVVTSDFTGTMGTVSIWGDVLPEGFEENRPRRYDAAFHEIFYTWDFGDGSAEFTRLENAPAAFRDANRAIGKVACHVYRQPGTYTARCTARQIKSLDPLTFVEVTQSTQITVGARLDGPTAGDPIWTSTNTIVLAKDGDFTGAPAGQQVTYGPGWSGAVATALADAGSRLGDNSIALRILLKRGETDITDTWFNGGNLIGNPARHVYVGTWGSGDRPVTDGIEAVGFSSVPTNYPETLIFDGIDIAGSLNHITRDYDGPDGGKSLFKFPATDGQLRLYNDITISDKWGIGFYIQAPTNDESQGHFLCINDCACDRVMDYAVYGLAGGVDSKAAILGLRAVHPANAPTYRSNEGPGLQARNQGPIRHSTIGDCIIDGGDFFTRFGWTPGSPWDDGTPKVAVQPEMRLGDLQAGTDSSARYQVTRVAAEGGSHLVSLANLSGLPTVQANLLIEGNLKVNQAGGRDHRNYTEGGAVTHRSNLYIFPDAPEVEGTAIHGAIVGGRNGVFDSDLVCEPVADYNNTVVTLGTSALIPDPIILDAFKTFTISNSIVYAPNNPGQSDRVDIAPFDGTILYAPRYAGRWEGGYDTELQTAFATPAGTISLYAPLAGSPVVGEAVAGYVALIDLLGAQRSPNADTGAIEAP